MVSGRRIVVNIRSSPRRRIERAVHFLRSRHSLECPGSAISLAGFQVITIGRIWAITEARHHVLLAQGLGSGNDKLGEIEGNWTQPLQSDCARWLGGSVQNSQLSPIPIRRAAAKSLVSPAIRKADGEPRHRRVRTAECRSAQPDRRIATASGARTSLIGREVDRLSVAVHHCGPRGKSWLMFGFPQP